MRSPRDMGADEIRVFMLHLVDDRKVSRETLRQVRAALTFLYGVTLRRPLEVEHLPVQRRQKRVPVILSGTEVGALLAAVRSDKYRVLLAAMYSAGLRGREACRLRAADVDTKRKLIRVSMSKGQRDRYTLLSRRLLTELRAYWVTERPEDGSFPASPPTVTSHPTRFHPHVHSIVTCGGLSPDRRSWVRGNPRYFLPVRVVARLFRGKFLAGLEEARRRGQLRFGGSTVGLDDDSAWAALRDRLYRTNWVVYAKPPFAGPDHVLRYLGRYTHRIALSNRRIVDFSGRAVAFTWRNYAAGGERAVMTLDAVEFLRRFLLHVLPKGFVRIRHYGLNASGAAAEKLDRARGLLAGVSQPRDDASHDAGQSWWDFLHERTGLDVMACTRCHSGRFVRRPISRADLVPGGCRAPPIAS